MLRATKQEARFEMAHCVSDVGPCAHRLQSMARVA